MSRDNEYGGAGCYGWHRGGNFLPWVLRPPPTDGALTVPRIIVKDSRVFGLVSGIVSRALSRVQSASNEGRAAGFLLTEETGMDTVVTITHTIEEARAAAHFLTVAADEAERRQAKDVAA